MVDMIPGASAGLSQAGSIMAKLVTGFGYLVMAAAVIGATYGIFWFLNNKIFRYNIPVTLKFEVGGTIIRKADKIWIKRSGEKWEVKFQKNFRLIAQIPPDECGYFIQSGLKSIKTFEGFVRDNQVAWVWPAPQTKVQLENQVIETFQTIKTNMVESYIHQLSKNQDLLLKKKWYQDPVIIAWGAMGFMVIAVIFIYLLYKNIPDQINGYLQFAHTLAQNCQGVQIK